MFDSNSGTKRSQDFLREYSVPSGPFMSLIPTANGSMLSARRGWKTVYFFSRLDFSIY